MEIKKYKPIGTKLENSTHAYFLELCTQIGITSYNFLQVVIDAFIKSFCTAEPITEYIQQVLDKFGDIVRTKYGFCFAHVNLPKIEMRKFLAIVTAPKKAIPEIVLIEKDEKQQILQNRNSDAILCEFLQAFSPTFLLRLEKIKGHENLHTITDTLKFCIDSNYSENELHEEIRELFLDNDWVLSIHRENKTDGYKKTEIEKIKQTRKLADKYIYGSINNETETDPQKIVPPVEDFETEIDTLEIADPVEDFETEIDTLEIADPVEDFGL